MGWEFLDSLAFARTFAEPGVAFLMGTLIGAERQWRQRTAGLRTNVLVAVGAAALTGLADGMASRASVSPGKVRRRRLRSTSVAILRLT